MSTTATPFDAVDEAGPKHDRTSAILGMWIFLGTEVLFFGGMFSAYAVYRYAYPQAFIAGSDELNLWSGGAMTAILLLGSLFIANAEGRARRIAEVEENYKDHDRTKQFRNSELTKPNGILWRLIITAVLGLLFLSLEFFEYGELISKSYFPGAGFDFGEFAETPLGGRTSEMFFVLFFCMTGVHALHMFIGIFLVSLCGIWHLRSRATSDYVDKLINVALYWHFVDIIWVFLYPLFYLVN